MPRAIFCRLLLMILLVCTSACGKDDPEPRQGVNPFQRGESSKDKSKNKNLMKPVPKQGP